MKGTFSRHSKRYRDVEESQYPCNLRRANAQMLRNLLQHLPQHRGPRPFGPRAEDGVLRLPRQPTDVQTCSHYDTT